MYGMVILQFIFDIIILLIGQAVAIKSWIIWIIEAILIAILLIGIITRDVYRDAIEEMEKKDGNKTKFIEELRVEIKVLSNNASGKQYEKEINKLNDVVRYTDPVTNKEVIELEDEILYELDNLKKAIEESRESDASSYINKLIELVNERAVRIKSLR